MKFIAAREALLGLMGRVIGVVERRNTLPILANVLIDAAADGGLVITGTDLEMQITVRDTVQVERPGAVTVPARKLYDLMRLLPEGVGLTLDGSDGKCVLRAAGGRYQMPTLPIDAFPQFDASPAVQEFSVSAAALRKALEKTAFCIAQQDVRFYLCGMLLEVSGDQLRVVASDGHRLACYAILLEEPVGAGVQVIVPRKGVQELLRSVGEQSALVTIAVSPNSLSADIGGAQIQIKLVNGKYPDYEKVLPKSIVREVIADRATLRLALSRLAIFSEDKLKSVRLDLQSAQLLLTSTAREDGQAEEVLPVQYEGAAFAVGFNATYLLEAITTGVDSSTVRLGFSDESQACLVRDAEDEQFKAVVMPLRL